MSSDTESTADTTVTSPPGSGSPEGLDRRRALIVTSGALLALLLASIDASAVSTALPTISRDLDGASLYSWPGIAFMVTAAVVVPIAGKLSDVFGRRRLLLGGVIGFVVSSLLCGLATSMIELVLFRGLQGVFGGVLLATILIVLGDLNEGAGRARAQAMASAVFGVGSIVGSPLGGFITDWLDWRWIFFVNIPLGAIAFVALLGTPAKAAGSGPRPRIDVRGTVALSIGVVALLIGLSELNDPTASQPLSIALITAGVVVMGAFVLLERTAENPLVPLSIFKYNQISVLATVGFLVNFGVIAASFYVPLLYQDVLGASAGDSGSRQIPLMLALIVATTVSGKYFPRVAHYRLLGAGVLVVLSATLWWLSAANPATAGWVPVVALVLCGIAIGGLYPMLTAVAQNAVTREQLAVATSQISFWRTLGGPVALAALGGVLGSAGSGASLGTPDQVAHSLHGVFVTAAVVVLVAAAVMLLLREVHLEPPAPRAAKASSPGDEPSDAATESTGAPTHDARGRATVSAGSGRSGSTS